MLLHSEDPLLSLSGLTFVIELLEVKCLIDSIVQKRTARIIELTLVYRHLKCSNFV